MKLKFDRKGKTIKVLLIFSDVDSSQMLERIVSDLNGFELLIKVVMIGNPEMKLASELRKFMINVKVIKKRPKHQLLLMILPIVKEFLHFSPSVFFASGQYATFIGTSTAFFFRTPSRIFIRHHTNSNSKFGLKSGVWVDKLSNRSATKIVAVSNVVHKILIEDENVAPEKVTVIPNGIDAAQFLQIRNYSDTDNLLNREIFKIGVISRITKVKGVEYIAEAFVKFNSIHPNSHLEIVGAFADSYSEVLNILNKLNGLSFTLSESTNSVQQFLSNLDVFVHTPIGPVEEAFGLVYLESLASGVPTVFTVSGILNEDFEFGKYSHLISYKNPDAILQELLTIHDANYQRKELFPEFLVQRFSLENMSSSYLKLLIG